MLSKLTALRAKLLRGADKLGWLAPLLIRVSVGIAFVVGGYAKLQAIDGVIEYFRSLGIPAPELQAPFVASLELVGGIALILGLGARLLAIPLTFTMAVALITAKLKTVEAWTDVFDFVEWHYLVFFFVIALIGPGAVSVDHFIAKKLTGAAVPPQPQ